MPNPSTEPLSEPRVTPALPPLASFRGVVVPLVTPVLASGQLDPDGISRLVDYVLGGGIQGLLVSGTTGECASLTTAQRARLLRLTAEAARGRARLFAGIGSNCLAEAVELARAALDAGYDAVVAHPPGYYQLTQSDLLAWYRHLADATPGPLLLYNIPQTTRHSISLEVVQALSEHPHVAGIKDSEYNIDRLLELITSFHHRPDFSVFIGPTVFSAQAMQAGARGFVPGVGNLAPRLMQDLFIASAAGEHDRAFRLQAKVQALVDVYQTGRTPGQAISDLKTMLHLLGVCPPHVLPPIQPTPASDLPALAEKLASLAPA